MATILIIEAEPRLRELYRRDLELEGYAVVTSASVEEEIERSGNDCPDLVVLDLQMPGIGCPEMVRRLKGRCPDERILINSAYSAHIDDFVCVGADAYVTKSTNTKALRAKIRELLASEAA